jgi:hypothetical protein
MGLKAEIPEKPEAQLLLEMIQTTGLPLVDGGLIDQPHIWLQELAVVVQARVRQDALAQAQEQG